jgi:hypothetical protein
MEPTDLDHTEIFTPTQAVADMLLYAGGGMTAEKRRDYIVLGIRLEAYMRDCGDPRAWEALDVADFVRATTQGRKSRMHCCCDLAAILSWVAGFGGVRKIDMAPHYDVLEQLCPPDAAAQAYIRWGGERMRGIEDDPPLELEHRGAGGRGN